MSLRISMQTLSPCLTPSFSKPPAMRAVRSATSAWLRFLSPLMMPGKSDSVDMICFGLFCASKQCRMRTGRFVIARSEANEAIQFFAALDCFATLAMTIWAFGG
jgi:hypothetical protein